MSQKKRHIAFQNQYFLITQPPVESQDCRSSVDFDFDFQRRYDAFFWDTRTAVVDTFL